MIRLEPAAIVHAELLAGMHAICFAEPWSARSMAEILSMPTSAGLIAVDGDSLRPAPAPPGPAGLVLWGLAGDEAEILTLAVLPPWRRHGLGGRLLAAALESCAAVGATAMFLEVAADNEAARALYHRHGFVAIGRRKGYYGCTDAVVMRHDLSTLKSISEAVE